MRLFFSAIVTAGLVLFGAATASAVSLTFVNPQPGLVLNPGDSFSIQMNLDTEGQSGFTSVFASVGSTNPSVLQFDNGQAPPTILASAYYSLSRVSNAFVLPSDPAGQIRAISYAGLDPTTVSTANQLVGRLNFTASGPGTTTLSLFIAPGDDVTINGVSIIDQVTGGSIEVTVVPEPGTALLMGLGLVGLAAAGRRKA